MALDIDLDALEALFLGPPVAAQVIFDRDTFAALLALSRRTQRAERDLAELSYDASTHAYELRELLRGWFGTSAPVACAMIEEVAIFMDRIGAMSADGPSPKGE